MFDWQTRNTLQHVAALRAPLAAQNAVMAASWSNECLQHSTHTQLSRTITQETRQLLRCEIDGQRLCCVSVRFRIECCDAVQWACRLPRGNLLSRTCLQHGRKHILC